MKDMAQILPKTPGGLSMYGSLHQPELRDPTGGDLVRDGLPKRNAENKRRNAINPPGE
jgi:hypothetical protein